MLVEDFNAGVSICGQVSWIDDYRRPSHERRITNWSRAALLACRTRKRSPAPITCRQRDRRTLRQQTAVLGNKGDQVDQDQARWRRCNGRPFQQAMALLQLHGPLSSNSLKLRSTSPRQPLQLRKVSRRYGRHRRGHITHHLDRASR